MKNARENWIDHVKVLACILVALGHFFQSMCTAGILNAGGFYQWFIRMIYYFHVPLFFICSGYVYQKYSKVYSFAEWRYNVLKKMISLGIPYFVFSLITWGMKHLFSGDVNSVVHGLGYDLFVHPMSPYWYLFALFFIFIITRTFDDKRTCYRTLAVAIILKAVSEVVGIYTIKIVAANQIWFVIGMTMCVFDFTEVAKRYKLVGYFLTGLFLLLSIWDWEFLSFAMGLIACSAVTILYANTFGKTSALAKYTMPVFLMHTIFAAGMRVVLLKLDITLPIIHIALGLGASFVGPIIAAEIMKKFKLDILYYPGKFIKINR